MSTSRIKVAAIQLASGNNVNANLLETERLVEAAAKQGARLVVLPENFAFMGHTCGDANTVREVPGDGPLQAFLAQLANRLGIWIVGGTIPLEADDASKWRAACTVYDARGRQVGRYDKQHLFDVNLIESDEQFVESESIEPGDSVVVIDSPVGRLGIAVCYDLRFPELFRAMVDRGVEVIALPAAFTAITGRAHWEILIRARAIENLSYVIASAQGGFHIASRQTFGHSMIVDPWGSKLALRERGNGCVVAEIDPEFQHTTRRSFPCLDHRRLHCR
ncbi:MAG: carbon-nitrogen hydrolase family protein [Chromatiaceae bacterium]|nr:carbon-nitrogen hydrolase family protein [Gammaproteobacteria bacterium]MCP5422912.1 carbon-nitrogen hydrolase family protein [Chromatiaceae bacterium]